MTARLDGSIVQGVTMCIVRDDLQVTPVRVDSLINVMTKFNIKSVKAIEAKTVDVGSSEVSDIKAFLITSYHYFTTSLYADTHLQFYFDSAPIWVKSLRSKTVLIDVFLVTNSS
ncbi:hypothetical protein MLD38_011187 [Melastoma candidum]|uniref:Uncharacterized protein n=1 Tax=Melastoma candidum TaxID=119954 RepID=A0ACB9R404_9MYRT|nr:hypothetical protein MLD38_011187 [Melastoma candidum]